MQPCASEAKQLPPLIVAHVDEREPEELASAADITLATATGRRNGRALRKRAADDEAQLQQRRNEENARLDELCESLARWVYTRKLFGAPSGPVSLLGKLRARAGTRPLKQAAGGPDAPCSSLLSALYIAVLRQPDSLDRTVFELKYFERIDSVKLAAAELKIGRQHWYTLLCEFRRRIYTVAVGIQQQNEAEAQAWAARR
jgi:hypothetical protein